MSRALDCVCGYRLTASDDEELFEAAKRHITEVHSKHPMTDDQVRQLVASQAHET
jgi:predicted small metal-binding protein